MRITHNEIDWSKIDLLHGKLAEELKKVGYELIDAASESCKDPTNLKN